MITSSQIYWLTRLDAIKDTACGFLFLGILVLMGGTIIMCFCLAWKDNEYYTDELKTLRKFKWIFWLGFFLVVFCSSILLFLPTTKEMAAIWIAPKIINNEKVQQLPNNAVDFANEWLKSFKPKQEK
jgi:hypothetical protein